ncbi:hypothetical protein [Aeromicrobium sp. CF3.5]|uniref:hypothetical protein n=1 Tax=Aeromicrobium sp. CF3.5 TaxID=3373078 RepID=UPI003EE51570
MTTFVALGACSGSSEPQPPAESTASVDPDGFTAEEREVVDAVDAYQAALIDYQKGDREIDLTEVATDEVADGIVGGVKQALDDEGLVMLGDYTLTPDSVTVSGGTAEYSGCLDNSRLLLVPEEDRDSPGVGSRPVGESTVITYQLTRTDDTWLVSQPSAADTPC